jgi:hypothetical protein
MAEQPWIIGIVGEQIARTCRLDPLRLLLGLALRDDAERSPPGALDEIGQRVDCGQAEPNRTINCAKLIGPMRSLRSSRMRARCSALSMR